MIILPHIDYFLNQLQKIYGFILTLNPYDFPSKNIFPSSEEKPEDVSQHYSHANLCCK
jgi:hypothetical protein